MELYISLSPSLPALVTSCPTAASTPSCDTVVTLLVSQRPLPLPGSPPPTFICHHQVLITRRSSNTPLLSSADVINPSPTPDANSALAESTAPMAEGRDYITAPPVGGEKKKKKKVKPNRHYYCVMTGGAVLLNSDGAVIDDSRLSVRFKVG